MFASNLRRERWAISRMDLSLPFPTSQSNANVKDRRGENLNLESFHFLRLGQVKIDVFMAGQASVGRAGSPGRIPLSGSPKWPEMRGRHTGSEPIVS